MGRLSKVRLVNCPKCGKEFDSLHYSGRPKTYCSPKCRSDINNKKRREKYQKTHPPLKKYETVKKLLLSGSNYTIDELIKYGKSTKHSISDYISMIRNEGYQIEMIPSYQLKLIQIERFYKPSSTATASQKIILAAPPPQGV